MKIKHNEIDKSIEIQDGLKNYSVLVKLLMILNLIIAILNLSDVNETGMGFMEIIWLMLGIICLVVRYIFIVKKSTLEKIPLEKLKKLKEKSIFGKKRFSLELINGKKRDLTELKREAEFNELRKLFFEIVIPS